MLHFSTAVVALDECNQSPVTYHHVADGQTSLRILLHAEGTKRKVDHGQITFNQVLYFKERKKTGSLLQMLRPTVVPPPPISPTHRKERNYMTLMNPIAKQDYSTMSLSKEICLSYNDLTY